MDITNQDGLRIVAAPTDRRAYDTWASDDEFCHQFLLHITATHLDHQGRSAVWKRAIERYWRDKCSRRELAGELGVSLDAIKSLLTLIRKAAEKFKTDGHAGFKSSQDKTVAWCGRVHSTITASDIYRIADGDREAIAHAEEYGRLTLRYQVKLFDPQISAQLETILVSEIDAAAIVRANALKKSVAKDDQFEGRPLIQNFLPYRPNYHADGRGRPRKVETHDSADTAPVAHIFMVPETKKNFDEANEAA